MARRAYLEVLSSSVKGLGGVGARLWIAGRVRCPHGWLDLRPEYGAMTGDLCMLEQGVGGWVIRNGRRNGVQLNGAAVRTAPLTSGDVIELTPGKVRFVEVEEPEVREPRLEELIAEAPEADERWQVYADHLLAQGDPLGERIRGLRTDEAEVLGTLQPLVTQHGVLTLEWSHGFVRRARVRAWGAIPVEEALCWLLALPVARFLQSLEIELRSFVHRTRLPRLAGYERVLGQIQSVLADAPLPALRELALGPVTAPPEGLKSPVALRHAPRLPPSPDGYLVRSREAYLVVEQSLPGYLYAPGEHLPLERGKTDRLELYAGPRHLGSVYWDIDGWSLFSASDDQMRARLRLNGLPAEGWPELRAGDRIEASGELALRFVC